MSKAVSGVQITDLIVYGPVCGQYHLFVDGDYFIATSTGGRINVEWTNQPKMVA